MTDQTAQEPTMEEILASIRRIISEDDAPAETAAAPQAAVDEVAPEPEPAPVAEVSPALMDETPSVQEDPPSSEDVLELTEEAPTEIIGDLDVSPAQPDPFPAVSESAYAVDQPIATPQHPSVPTSTTPAEPLVGAGAASTAASAFAGLASQVRRPEPAEPSTFGGPTIDELARQLLRPMLKDWLDANLPAIVEAQVRKEVERIARSAG